MGKLHELLHLGEPVLHLLRAELYLPVNLAAISLMHSLLHHNVDDDRDWHKGLPSLLVSRLCCKTLRKVNTLHIENHLLYSALTNGML